MIEGYKQKQYDPELEKIPHYLRERVAYLIDSSVDKKVRAYMDEFRHECFKELDDQRKVNQQHIEYYTKSNQDDGNIERFDPQSALMPRLNN